MRVAGAHHHHLDVQRKLDLSRRVLRVRICVFIHHSSERTVIVVPPTVTRAVARQRQRVRPARRDPRRSRLPHRARRHARRSSSLVHVSTQPELRAVSLSPHVRLPARARFAAFRLVRRRARARRVSKLLPYRVRVRHVIPTRLDEKLPRRIARLLRDVSRELRVQRLDVRGAERVAIVRRRASVPDRHRVVVVVVARARRGAVVVRAMALRHVRASPTAD